VARRKPAPVLGPVYEDGAPAAVATAAPLAYPFTLDGVRWASVVLLPPTFGALENLRDGAVIDATDVLAAFDVPPDVTRAMRWPDVDAVLGAAIAQLPPDLAAWLLNAKVPSDDPATVPEAEPVPAPPPGFPDVGGPVEWDGDSGGMMTDFLHDPVRIDHG